MEAPFTIEELPFFRHPPESAGGTMLRTPAAAVVREPA
jgi:hypothetical protein